MTTEPRFVPWKGTAIMEKDLPPGVRYRSEAQHPDTVMVALQDGQRVVEYGGDSKERWFRSTVSRDDIPIIIIDWPDYCGPRPDDKPTWNDIIDRAPSQDAITVWSDWTGYPRLSTEVRNLTRSTGTPPDAFLGWFDLGGKRLIEGAA